MLLALRSLTYCLDHIKKEDIYTYFSVHVHDTELTSDLCVAVLKGLSSEDSEIHLLSILQDVWDNGY